VAIWYRQTTKNIWKDHLEEELYRKSALLCWWSGMNKLGLIDHNIISGWCSTPTLLLICSSFSMGKWSSIAHDCSSGSSTAQIWIKKHPITFLREWKFLCNVNVVYATRYKNHQKSIKYITQYMQYYFLLKKHRPWAAPNGDDSGDVIFFTTELDRDSFVSQRNCRFFHVPKVVVPS